MQKANVQPRKSARRLPPSALQAVVSGLLLFAFFAPSSALADIQLPSKGRTRGERELRKIAPPPAPVPTTVRMEPGGRAEIVLQATGAQGRTIDFFLRTPPAHGGFEGNLRRVDRDRVAVTYVHRAADGPGHDAFTFAAQAPGTPVSAAETVSIEVIDRAPPPAGPAPVGGTPDVAATPADLDFGAVEAGRSTGVTLALENRGGGEATGRLNPPAPWSVQGDPGFRLGPGGRQTFRLTFRPTGEGSFAETLRIDVDGAGRTAGCVVRLVGTGLAAAPTLAVNNKATPTPAPVVAAAAPAPAAVATPPPAAREDAAAPHDVPGATDPGTFPINDAQVTAVTVRAVGIHTVELTWKPPVPLPSSYRVERRSFVLDDQEYGGVRTDWRLWDRTDFQVRAGEATATVRGLAPGEPVTLRVVSVDSAGRLAPASPTVDTATAEHSTWWRPTTLKALGLALAGCLGLLARRRWQEHQLMRELDARHAPEEPSIISGQG